MDSVLYTQDTHTKYTLAGNEKEGTPVCRANRSGKGCQVCLQRDWIRGLIFSYAGPDGICPLTGIACRIPTAEKH